MSVSTVWGQVPRSQAPCRRHLGNPYLLRLREGRNELMSNPCWFSENLGFQVVYSRSIFRKWQGIWKKAPIFGDLVWEVIIFKGFIVVSG